MSNRAPMPQAGYRRGINRVPSPLRANLIPYLTIMTGSLIPFFFIADTLPLIVPMGFMVLIGWRIMRPGLLPLWAGAPLGAFDDLLSGQPFGSAILLFSLIMIALELIEQRFPWRGFWQDWFTASLCVAAYVLASLLIVAIALPGNLDPSLALASLPQIAMGILLYPFIAQMIARLDRFRLARSRRIA